MLLKELLSEHFRSDVGNLELKQFKKVVKDTTHGEFDKTIDDIKYIVPKGIRNGSDAVYLVVSYDGNDDEWLVNEFVLNAYHGGSIKVKDYSSVPIETFTSLQAAKNFADKHDDPKMKESLDVFEADLVPKAPSNKENEVSLQKIKQIRKDLEDLLKSDDLVKRFGTAGVRSNTERSNKILDAAEKFQKTTLVGFNKIKAQLDKNVKAKNVEALEAGLIELKKFIKDQDLQKTVTYLKTRGKWWKPVTPVKTWLVGNIDLIFQTKNSLEKVIKRMKMTDKQKAAADKASTRMKGRWMENTNN